MAVTCGLITACGLTPAAIALSPRPGEPVVVFTLVPDAPVPRAVAASAARILWLSAGGHVAVLAADPATDLATDLRLSGAFLVLAAGPLGLCRPGTRLPGTRPDSQPTGFPQP